MSRILFLCASASARSIMAGSLLATKARNQWDVWSTPTPDEQGRLLVERVLREQGIAPLPSDHLIEPTFGMQWDEGVILCSGAANT